LFYISLDIAPDCETDFDEDRRSVVPAIPSAHKVCLAFGNVTELLQVKIISKGLLADPLETQRSSYTYLAKEQRIQLANAD
jgi:hypothetical protein